MKKRKERREGHTEIPPSKKKKSKEIEKLTIKWKTAEEKRKKKKRSESLKEK